MVLRDALSVSRLEYVDIASMDEAEDLKVWPRIVSRSGDASCYPSGHPSFGQSVLRSLCLLALEFRFLVAASAGSEAEMSAVAFDHRCVMPFYTQLLVRK